MSVNVYQITRCNIPGDSHLRYEQLVNTDHSVLVHFKSVFKNTKKTTVRTCEVGTKLATFNVEY
jgi:hypothetical protein